MFVYNFTDSTSEKIAGGVHTAPTWVNDSTIIYTKRSKPNKWGSRFFDLYRYDVMEEEEGTIGEMKEYLLKIIDMNTKNNQNIRFNYEEEEYNNQQKNN